MIRRLSRKGSAGLGRAAPHAGQIDALAIIANLDDDRLPHG